MTNHLFYIQEGCGGVGLVAISHPESKPVIVLFEDDMTNHLFYIQEGCGRIGLAAIPHP